MRDASRTNNFERLTGWSKKIELLMSIEIFKTLYSNNISNYWVQWRLT